MWGDAIVLTNSAQAYKLSERMTASDANAPKTAHLLEIQVGLDAGNVRVYLGGPNVSPTHWFVMLTADQQWSPPRLPNWHDLEKIYLYSDTAGVTLGVLAI